MKFKTLLVDPPWAVQFIQLRMRPNQVEMPYSTMSTEELCDLGKDLLPVLNAETCNLFLWTTHTFLPAGLVVLDAWGFKYHCCLTWDKTNGRPCWGFKRKTEFLLYGYKGKIGVNQRGTFIPTLFTEKLTTHSTKPEILFQILENNTPEPRLQLFARDIRPGWLSIGDAITGRNIRLDLELLAGL